MVVFINHSRAYSVFDIKCKSPSWFPAPQFSVSDDRPCSAVTSVRFHCTVPGNSLRWFPSDRDCSIKYVEGARGSGFGTETVVEEGQVDQSTGYSWTWKVFNDSVVSTLHRRADLLNGITVSCVDQHHVVIGSSTVQLASKYPEVQFSC